MLELSVAPMTWTVNVIISRMLASNNSPVLLGLLLQNTTIDSHDWNMILQTLWRYGDMEMWRYGDVEM